MTTAAPDGHRDAAVIRHKVRHEAKHLERVKGIEPSYEAWEAAVLPLNYTRAGMIVVGPRPPITKKMHT